MSLTGNGTKSIRRQDVQEQKSIAIGLKKLVMAHKATLGDTGINLTSLSTPSEMSSLGFINPTSAEILAANLKFYRSNLRVVSSHKGLLMDYLSYNVTNSSRIDFIDFTAEADEIFMITFDDNAKTGVQMVDAAPLTSTGTLAVGVTDYNVGTPFEVNKYPLMQVGAVLVFRNGVIQFRNTNNGTSGGNYREIDAGSGLGVIIRFNNAPASSVDNIMVVSNGLLAYRPDGSLMAEIETLAGQIDTHKDILETITGTPVPTGAPNNVDLKAFGDQVLDHENRIDAIEAREIRLPVGYGSTRSTNSSGIYYNFSGAGVTLTPGYYRLDALVGFVRTAGAAGITNYMSYWSTENGTDTATPPADLLSNVNVQVIGGSRDGTINRIDYNLSVQHDSHTASSSLYIKLTGTLTVYATGRLVHSGGSFNVYSTVNAYKVREL